MEHSLVEKARKLLAENKSEIFLLEQNHHPDATNDNSGMICSGQQTVVFIPLIAAGIISLIITIYFIVHANSNVKNDTAKKIMWTIILIFVSCIGCIVYYFVEILINIRT